MSFLSQFLDNLELKVLKIIDSPKKSILWYFLFLLSRVYILCIRLRYQLYRKHFFRKRHSIGNLVISIGNISCGGTGKTPITEVIARELIKNKRKVAILSRGYKSKGSNVPVIVSDGESFLEKDALIAGDEPVMLAKNVPKAVVVSHKNRVESGILVTQKFGVDTIILDDGFQYFKLIIHLNILLIDATSPFSNHHLLPCGLLREPITNINRADFIFLTKSDGRKSLNHLKRFIRSHNKKAEIIECNHKEKFLCSLKFHKIFSLELMKGKKIAIFSGIAKPDSFQKLLEKYNPDIVYREDFADHHFYSKREMRSFVKKSLKKGAELIITTEKDAARFQSDSDFIDNEIIPSFYLRIEIELISGEESFSECIKRICWL